MGNSILGYAKRNLPLNRILILLAVFFISVVFGYGVFDSMKKEIRIVDGDNDILVKTMGDDIGTVFQQLSVQIESFDYVSAPLSMKLSDDMIQEVFIKRAIPVNIHL